MFIHAFKMKISKAYGMLGGYLISCRNDGIILLKFLNSWMTMAVALPEVVLSSKAQTLTL